VRRLHPLQVDRDRRVGLRHGEGRRRVGRQRASPPFSSHDDIFAGFRNDCSIMASFWFALQRDEAQAIGKRPTTAVQ